MTRRTFFHWSSILTGLVLALPGRAQTHLRTVIDAETKAVWQREKITPAGRADDAAFVRRIYLDLAGTSPTVKETRHVRQDALEAHAEYADGNVEKTPHVRMINGAR
jgi:Protein of unknown function (DUF1549)